MALYGIAENPTTFLLTPAVPRDIKQLLRICESSPEVDFFKLDFRPGDCMTVATSLSASTRPICLLVADNNRMSSHLLADVLKRDHRIARVCPTASFPEALATATTEMVSVALVSCEMDRECQKGFALARELRKIRHGLQIVMLLESSCRDSVIGAFRAGASGVFCRTSSIALLTKCIHAVHAGQI